MTISENIAKYRKAKGLTQEQLGEILGVSNQAVSKWESAVSMPDIMLLPRLADALGITLEELYGIEEKRTEEKVKADDFPKAANDRLIEYFVSQSGFWFVFTKSEEENINHFKNSIYGSGECVLSCISDEAGAVFVSNDLSFINTNYKAAGSEGIFEKREIASTLKKLSDSQTRTVLTYLYRASFSENNTNNKSFFIETTAKDCGLSEEDTYDIFEKLRSINLLESYYNDKTCKTEYLFLKSRAVFVLAAFQLLDKLTREFVFKVLRDTSTITDYAFEKLR